VPLPRHLPALAATSQNSPPHSPQMMHKNSHPNEVARNSVPVYPGAPRPNQPAIIILDLNSMHWN
jgi:hypothetical protein